MSAAANLAQSRPEEEEIYRNFSLSLASKYTRRTYEHAFKKFVRFVGLETDPAKYKKITTEYDSKALENIIKNYIIDAKEKGRSQASLHIDCAAIKHFFEMNDVEIKWTKKLDKFKNMKLSRDEIADKHQQTVAVEDRAYTMEEVREAFNRCKDIRAKVMISILASTGIRKGAFFYLRLRNLEPIDEHQIYKITVYEGEGPDEYFTFCTPECRREIDKYLDYRQRNGEILKPESPLIREQFNVARRTIKTAKPHFLGEGGVNRIMQMALEVDSGIRERKKIPERQKRPVSLSHGFRKFFETVAINNGVSVLYVRRLLGQKTGLEDSYFKPTWKELLEGNDKVHGYLSIIDELTINEENKLQKEIHELRVNQDKMLELAAEVAEVKQFMKSLKKK